MRISAIACVVLSVLVSTAAFGRGSGGGGMHHSASMNSASMTGGASGTRSAAPGTNSAGTALSSGGNGIGPGPALGTGDPAVDREDRRAARMISSICRGC
jgi:hypothetical protein